MLIKENQRWGHALSFALVFSSIFGFKIGYLDFSLIIPYSILTFCIAVRQLVRFNRSLLIIAGLVGILLTYQIVIQLLYSTFDVNSLLRLTRSILICILCSALVASDLFSSRQVINAIFYSLLAHALLVDVAALFDPLNYWLSAISENDRVRPLRASGLLAGFDIAGLLCLFGLLMILLKVIVLRSRWTAALLSVFFLLGCFFTSRVSIAFALLFVFVYGIHNLYISKLAVIAKIAVILGVMLPAMYLVREYVAPIVEVTFSLGILDIDTEQRDRISSRHAVQNTDYFLWSYMFYLPNGYLATMFGTGLDELYSDVGYVKDIFRYGVLGMLYSIFIYFCLFFVGKRALLRQGKTPYYALLKMVFLLIFVLTLKNNYFFTRAVFPLTLLLVCVSVITRSEANARTPHQNLPRQIQSR